MNIKKRMNQFYLSDKTLNRSDYEESRKLFIYEGCMAAGILSLTSGAFLAGFANYMGASDEFNGIIGAIPAAAGAIQIFSSLIFERLEKRKLLIVAGSFLFRLLLSVMFLIPLICQGTTSRLAVLGVLYGAAYLLSSVVNPPSSNWIVDLTPEPIRGSYFARRDAISLGFLTILTIVIGMVMDYFRGLHNEYAGFLIIGILVLLMTFLNFYILGRIKEPSHHRKALNIKLKDAVIEPIRDRRYRKVVILFVLWNIGIQIGGPFFAIYMVTGLKLDYTFIMAMSVLTTMVRIFTVKYWGRMADRWEWMLSTKISIAILGIAHLGWFFINSETVYYLMPLLNILGGIAWAGVNISLFNIPFVMAPEEGRTMYLGSSSAIGGIAGFLSALAGAFIVNKFKMFRFDFAGIHLCNMHIVFMLSGILLLMTACYVHRWRKRNTKSKAAEEFLQLIE